jgi:hypothetical protein
MYRYLERQKVLFIALLLSPITHAFAYSTFLTFSVFLLALSFLISIKFIRLNIRLLLLICIWIIGSTLIFYLLPVNKYFVSTFLGVQYSLLISFLYFILFESIYWNFSKKQLNYFLIYPIVLVVSHIIWMTAEISLFDNLPRYIDHDFGETIYIGLRQRGFSSEPSHLGYILGVMGYSYLGLSSLRNGKVLIAISVFGSALFVNFSVSAILLTVSSALLALIILSKYRIAWLMAIIGVISLFRFQNFNNKYLDLIVYKVNSVFSGGDRGVTIDAIGLWYQDLSISTFLFPLLNFKHQGSLISSFLDSYVVYGIGYLLFWLILSVYFLKILRYKYQSIISFAYLSLFIFTLSSTFFNNMFITPFFGVAMFFLLILRREMLLNRKNVVQ